jgi:hypothetical protein
MVVMNLVVITKWRYAANVIRFPDGFLAKWQSRLEKLALAITDLPLAVAPLLYMKGDIYGYSLQDMGRVQEAALITSAVRFFFSASNRSLQDMGRVQEAALITSAVRFFFSASNRLPRRVAKDVIQDEIEEGTLLVGEEGRIRPFGYHKRDEEQGSSSILRVVEAVENLGGKVFLKKAKSLEGMTGVSSESVCADYIFTDGSVREDSCTASIVFKNKEGRMILERTLQFPMESTTSYVMEKWAICMALEWNSNPTAVLVTDSHAAISAVEKSRREDWESWDPLIRRIARRKDKKVQLKFVPSHVHNAVDKRRLDTLPLRKYREVKKLGEKEGEAKALYMIEGNDWADKLCYLKFPAITEKLTKRAWTEMNAAVAGHSIHLWHKERGVVHGEFNKLATKEFQEAILRRWSRSPKWGEMWRNINMIYGKPSFRRLGLLGYRSAGLGKIARRIILRIVRTPSLMGQTDTSFLSENRWRAYAAQVCPMCRKEGRGGSLAPNLEHILFKCVATDEDRILRDKELQDILDSNAARAIIVPFVLRDLPRWFDQEGEVALNGFKGIWGAAGVIPKKLAKLLGKKGYRKKDLLYMCARLGMACLEGSAHAIAHFWKIYAKEMNFEKGKYACPEDIRERLSADPTGRRLGEKKGKKRRKKGRDFAGSNVDQLYFEKVREREEQAKRKKEAWETVLLNNRLLGEKVRERRRKEKEKKEDRERRVAEILDIPKQEGFRERVEQRGQKWPGGKTKRKEGRKRGRMRRDAAVKDQGPQRAGKIRKEAADGQDPQGKRERGEMPTADLVPQREGKRRGKAAVHRDPQREGKKRGREAAERVVEEGVTERKRRRRATKVEMAVRCPIAGQTPVWGPGMEVRAKIVRRMNTVIRVRN